MITVYNKADKAEKTPGNLYVSAKFGDNLPELKAIIQEKLFGSEVENESQDQETL
jgi:50S ribosomal subunit-associated GTPase HflX